jgi:thiol-disulfide isomerase/thioredoxin
MLKRGLVLAIAITAFALTGIAASAKRLSVGDPAPRLTVKKFVKGVPVTKFERGKLYVVEFWATWCGPCKMSIPHLTELQKKYKEVTFIGVSIFEQSQQGVAPFVAQMGAKMDYRVAMDSVPAGKGGDKGLMAVNWMEASGQTGIPTAFIVDKEGRIAWLGHPMTMEGTLARVVAGTWDTKRAAARINVNNRLRAAYQARDYAKVLAVADAAIKDDPTQESRLSYLKFTMLVNLNRNDEAAAYGNKLIFGLLRHNPQALNQLAWGIVDPAAKKNSAPLVAMALQAAQKADQVSMGREAAIADTLAAAYFASGQAGKAVETQQRSLALAKGTQSERDPALAQHLALYKRALK